VSDTTPAPAASARPLPEPDERSAPYWEAAARHELRLPRCSRCEGFTMPPDAVCPRCGTTEPAFAFVAVTGAGSIRSWTVVRQSFLAGFDVPFVLVDVALDDAPDVRLIGRLLDGPAAAIHLDDRVTLAFEDLADGVAVPAFALDAR
jgi:uncharacterized OB-fold protein